LVVDNVLTLGILPFFLHKADNYIVSAEQTENT
jgi:fructoselysine and glucoselysine-specific PTS system IIC component